MDRMHVIVLIVQELGDGQPPGMVVNLQNILGASTWCPGTEVRIKG